MKFLLLWLGLFIVSDTLDIYPLFTFFIAFIIFFLIGLYDFLRLSPKDKKHWLSFYCNYPNHKRKLFYIAMFFLIITNFGGLKLLMPEIKM